MKRKREWQAVRLGFNAIGIFCDSERVDENGQILSVSHTVSPAHRRRIDYDPWLIIQRMSRQMDALEAQHAT